MQSFDQAIHYILHDLLKYGRNLITHEGFDDLVIQPWQMLRILIVLDQEKRQEDGLIQKAGEENDVFAVSVIHFFQIVYLLLVLVFFIDFFIDGTT